MIPEKAFGYRIDRARENQLLVLARERENERRER